MLDIHKNRAILYISQIYKINHYILWFKNTGGFLMIKTIVKRDGREAEFDISKISNAIFKAAEALGGSDRETALELADQVVDYVENGLGISKPGKFWSRTATQEPLRSSSSTARREAGCAR